MIKNRTCVTVESLLLPRTTDTVRRAYESLAERAQLTSFGLLEEDIVMLDTETTGLSYKKNELIEIAAARINGGKISETFKTFVKPHGIIPAEIQVLTGITHYDVQNAPSSHDAVAELAEFVGGMPVVAHNATFDRSFIESVDGGTDVSDTWVDSLALSRIALPRLSSHRLSDMAEAFGCASVTHRAMADVEALSGMWRILLLALSDLPTPVLDRMAHMHEDVPWEYRPIIAHVAAERYGERGSLRDVRRNLVAQMALGHRRQDPMELMQRSAANLNSVPSSWVDEAFASGGMVSRMYDKYEQRTEQVAMAQEVRAALSSSTHRAVEAGTGVGKSMGYLIPAIGFAQSNDVTVGIATKTNALTDQLVSHELPALNDVLQGRLSYCSIKGYDHYPCMHKVELATVRELPLDRVSQTTDPEPVVADNMLTALAVVMSYAAQSPDGDLDALGIRWRNVPRDMLTTTPAECLRSRCPFYPNECFVHGARRRASAADVVVTNHSLLLRNIALDGAILPPIRHWIVDEAHSFEQEARRQWAKELSAEVSNRVLLTLGGLNTGVIHHLLTEVSDLDSSTLVAGLLTKAAAHVQRASVASADLLNELHALMAVAETAGGYESTTLWIDDNVRRSDEWHALEGASARAADAFEACAKTLDSAIEVLTAESPQLANELTDATRGIKDMLDSVRLIVLEPDSTYVYSAELYRARRRMGHERLVAEKLDIGADLANTWYPESMSVTYTSATIAVGENFDHFNHAVGLDLLPEESHASVRLDSSFDYHNHMSVVTVRDMPAPGGRGYLEDLERLLFDIHVAMDGSVLTLFTNRREMEQVYAALSPRLMDAGLELACQDRRSSPRRISERFMMEKRLSLFALKSFWEGFDAAGDTLRCVVIPRLPFASPRDPLVCEREAREQRAWWRYSLPEAVLSVKQAAGRLIRTASDTGVVVLADSRVCTKRYGRTFLNALPSQNATMLERANVGRYLQLWRASHERT